MKQIGKFKARMKNVTRASTEYRMTILEAKELLDEILQLESRLSESLSEKTKIIEIEKVSKQVPISSILDGGTFIQK
jgi:hypothetical protein